LTDVAHHGNIWLMFSRRLVCLTLVYTVLVLSMCLVPVGHGPFVASYGPRTKFQALQALLLLRLLMAAAISICAGRVFSATFRGLASPEGCGQIVPDFPSANSALRC
jgi:hypothetical protein